MFVQLKDFPDYAVTDEGEVISLKFGRWKVLKPTPDSDGYPQIHLSVKGRKLPKKVHTLVADVFLGSRPTGLEVNHKNGMKTDNTMSNLEYITHAQNVEHAWDVGLRDGMVGEKHPNTKLTNDQKRSLRRLKGIVSAKEAAQNYKVSLSTVHKLWASSIYDPK